ncbi:MAG: hypothetical protein A3C43_09100 [Candidatus Schekmanbacteria bacterium RIFCSPHIGHO2_02_FULL_38_11]|uniref:Tellurium resistance protein TerC n=1 Tax=Candidatus Schekmanbacteria bacterium RIFCSPLOWO2_12_FULL_38_15 TaxID=1817883 RepID=A0A1F7SM71_9BACT|nr:MAG: hypothetical protein A2043_02115 [Candidatus Schekmanbacteria bacterium GWA2_38_9]OGL48673.1 MAG: hypothetical protein A3H37_04335 [Candidatus Schekmanbacteria bacterium RIFCSPLOWO2_02_FULL_38_14]OGL49176.1 MAG: hypothetical protein A3C43_09100 [Candidatus Schekmanbacteria bacterium RIFCSPHIGHO2_02_FULL_38_11]OGL54328.1 MAG: hypothetical protein A3G31_12020 [Candidatus Schekmanbacteria bacterium RIFCSPLOWO2_12_FULL_38_15]
MTVFILKTIKQAKKLIIAVIGFTVLLIGLTMIVLPGPAFIVIPLGLGILATEFVWARRVLEKVKDKVNNIKDKVSNKGGNNHASKTE